MLTISIILNFCMLNFIFELFFCMLKYKTYLRSCVYALKIILFSLYIHNKINTQKKHVRSASILTKVHTSINKV